MCFETTCLHLVLQKKSSLKQIVHHESYKTLLKSHAIFLIIHLKLGTAECQLAHCVGDTNEFAKSS